MIMGNESRLTRRDLFFWLCKGGVMRLLRLAVEKQRWDLAAHTIVLGTASVLKETNKKNASQSKGNKRGTKGQPER